MDKKELYKFIEQYKSMIYGVDKGFDYLDFLISELKKEKSNEILGVVKVFDYKSNHYFNVSEIEFNARIQNLYTDFVFKEQILKFGKFNLVYDNLIKKLKTTSDVALSNYHLILKFFFFLIKEMTLGKSVLENNISKSEFLTKIVKIMDKYVLNNTRINTELAELILEILVEENIIKKSYFNISLLDVNFFSFLKYMRLQMVDIYTTDNISIKYSSSYLMSIISNVIINYIDNVNLDVYNNLLFLLESEKDLKLEEIRNFILDFTEIELFPKNFETKDQKVIAFFERIHLYKLILNEYCFNVLAVSCFESFFFSKEKVTNILLQKSDPRLNLSPNIYIVNDIDINIMFNK